MTEPVKPKSYFGRVLLANIGLVLVLHLGRTVVAPDSGIYGALFFLAFIDFLLFIIALLSGKGETGLAFFLSMLLVFLVGFSDCGTHFHLDVR
ncbi:hypothetical protein [Hymenobacter crusticola]|uniref:Uncharacterized protein n=1 Tax=Hymenobacter crusticola TaxID=1770526 RepID=A0A243WBD2_9BACT|nr:hypothetical protein [Hymenobacter crusticola]OUJ72903.1 hypothetical protein BXP70_16510 [Hymenobacter crusticola]